MMVCGQLIFQVMATIQELILNLFGLSAVAALESATLQIDTFSLFLYAGILGPIAEEVLFRGLIMRSLEPYGKKFAILASAFLFGIFHCNIVQSPYAFAVGLVLGYVAMEHSLLWAMVLHMINNLLLADSMPRLMQNLPLLAQEIIFAVVIWGCAIAAIVLLIVRRKEVSAYLKQGKMHPLCLKSFLTAPGILVLTGVLIANIVLTIVLQAL
jgi:membrane protease YdiL (CAAX protease family)